jgi:phage/plasmid-like protein (TIGR03299 family)
MPKIITLDPSGANDQTEMYLVLYTSHDGSVAIQAMITPVRVVCQNTLNLAMHSSKQSFKIRHTQTLDGRIASARQALGLTFAYADEFELEAKALFETAVTDKKFAQIVNAIYPKPAEDSSKVGLTKWENKVQLVNDLYFKSPTSANVKGTAWGVANALTERIDYFRSSRGNSENLMASASGFDPVTTAEKRRVFNKVKTLAGVK